MSFLSQSELEAIGFESIGKGVKISSKASIYNPGRISIGDNVRIDDFCVLSAGDGGIEIGSHVHIAVFSSLIGSARITLGEFAGLSAKASVLSSADDFSGEHLVGPCIPNKYRKVSDADVTLASQVVIGVGSVILPGVTIGVGTAVGALSLVNRDLPEFSVAVGVPCKVVKERSRRLLDSAEKFRQEWKAGEILTK